jgi:rod shape-determining protein MreB
MKDGVIADFEVTEAMLRYFIMQAHNRRTLVKPRIIICVPSGHYRSRKARGAGLGARGWCPRGLPDRGADGPQRSAPDCPSPSRRANMIVDIGGGTTEVAVISLAGIVVSKSIRVGGDKLDEAIVQHIKRKYNLLIGERTAEDIKKQIGSAYPLDEVLTMDVKGRDLVAGVPKTLTINSDEIRDALAEPVNAIVEAVRVVLERTPPELSADIVDKGIVLSGWRLAAQRARSAAARRDGTAGGGFGDAAAGGGARLGQSARRAATAA